MQVEWTNTSLCGTIDIDPADYKGKSPEEIKYEIRSLCHYSAEREADADVPGLDAAVAAVVEALKGQNG